MKTTAIGIDTHSDNRANDDFDEARLVDRARRGDVTAFEHLYRHHAGRINALCLRLCGDAGVAEDCVQETFVSAWQHLATFAGDSRFATWLHRIAVNQALGVKRKVKRRSNHLRVVDASPDDGGETPLDRAPAPRRDDAAQIDLERAISDLPEQARKVFVLVSLNGYSHEEVSECLGIAVGTSKAQQHRARKLLMQRLER